MLIYSISNIYRQSSVCLLDYLLNQLFYWNSVLSQADVIVQRIKSRFLLPSCYNDEVRYFGLLSSHLRLEITFSIKNRLAGAAFGLPVLLFSFYDSFLLSLKSIFSSKLSSLTCFSICRWQTLSLIYKRIFLLFPFYLYL